MGLSTSVLQQLQACLVANPALVARLQECRDDGEAVALLLDLARQAGLDLDPAEPAAHFARGRTTGLAGSPQESTHELDDRQLENIAAGRQSKGLLSWKEGNVTILVCGF